jgi:hypothetical protein
VPLDAKYPNSILILHAKANRFYQSILGNRLDYQILCKSLDSLTVERIHMALRLIGQSMKITSFYEANRMRWIVLTVTIFGSILPVVKETLNFLNFGI